MTPIARYGRSGRHTRRRSRRLISPSGETRQTSSGSLRAAHDAEGGSKMPRTYERKFDWDEAKRLQAGGLNYTQIAERLGVTRSAVYRALNDAFRKRQEDGVKRWQSNGTCPNCGNRASRTGGIGQHLCMACSHDLMATTVRPDELQCMTCREWKQDTGFPHDRNRRARRQRHNQCRACLTQAKREWRARYPEKAKAANQRDYALKLQKKELTQ